MQQQGGASTIGTTSSEHLSRSTSEVASGDQSTVAALPTASSSSTIPVLPDGRCFFRSVVISTNQYLVVANRHSSGQLCDDMLQIAENAKTDMLRASVMQFMCENVNQYASFTGDALNVDMPTHVPKFNSLAGRINFMSDSTAMVGELEITATAKLLKRPIHVSNNHHGTVYRYGDEEFTNVLPIHVKFTPMGDSCGHYEPVVSTSPADSGDGQPSYQGGGQPSYQGGGQPSSQGGGQPSYQGGGQPSSQGGGEPSSQGGGEPSSQICGQPSSQIGGQPSSQIGGQPSSQIGGQSSSQGGGQPSSQIGGQPSSQGGGQPSSQGGGQPSSQIGGQPSSQSGGQPSSQGGGQPSSTPERVRVTAISPIPVKQPKIMRRQSRATTAEILTSSPYKTALSKAKARNARSGSQGKKRLPKPKPSSTKQAHSTTKQASSKHNQTGTKKGESDWYCFICTESVMDDMIQCQVCNAWVHSACADVSNTGQFVCEPCQE